MTDELAFRATYANWKCIPSRGVVQIVLEIAMERPISDHAYQVLGGMPNPGADTWVAVARLTPSGVVVAPSTPAPAPEPAAPTAPARATNRLTVQAAITCGDELFQAYLRHRWCMPTVVDKDTAAAGMRQILCIESRKELLPDSEAAYWYGVLMADYEAWAHPDIIGETPETPGLPPLAANTTVRDLPRQHHDGSGAHSLW